MDLAQGSGFSDADPRGLEAAYEADALQILKVAPALYVVGLCVEAWSHIGHDTVAMLFPVMLACACAFLFVRFNTSFVSVITPHQGLFAIWFFLVATVALHVYWLNLPDNNLNWIAMLVVVIGTGAFVISPRLGEVLLALSSVWLLVLFARSDSGEELTALSVPLLAIFAGWLLQYVRRRSLQDRVEKMQLMDKLHHQQLEAQASGVRAAVATQLSAGFAHHFNNRLQSVVGSAELLEHSLTQEGDAALHLNNILESTMEAAAMIQELNRYADRAGLHLSRFSAAAFAQELRVRQPGVAVENAEALDVIEIYGDREKLLLAVEALIKNARQAVSATDGRIAIQIERSETGTNLSVLDNGAGFDPEIVDRVCEPFVTSRATERFGLGLALVESIIHRHDGQLHIAQRPDGGSKVTLCLENQ